MAELATRLSRVMEALEEGLLVMSPDGVIVECNAQAPSLLGLPLEQLLGRSDLDPRWGLQRPDRTPLPADEVPSVRARATRQPVLRQRVAMRLPSGAVRELLVSAIPEISEAGQLERVVVAFLDVSRELELVSELRTYQQFFERAPDLFIVADGRLAPLQVNDATTRLLGWPRSRWLGEGLRALVHPADVALLARQDLSLVEAEFVVRMHHADGTWRSIAWRTSPALLDGDRCGCFARGVDVTERLHDQAQLQRTRGLLTEALDLVGIGVLDQDLRDGTEYASQRLRTLIGAGREAGASQALRRAIMPDDLGRYEGEYARSATQGLRAAFPLRLRSAEGSSRDVRCWLQPFHDEQGRTVRLLTALQDVTEQSLLQAKLQLTERLASLGTMAAGVAHEINNPLAFIMANLNVVRTEFKRLPQTPGVDLADLRDAVAEAIEGAERIRAIVQGLKTFSRVDEHQRGSCDVHRILQAALNMARNELRHRARIVIDLQPVSPVLGNEARLGQVFLNLLVNAAQAMPDGHATENCVTVSAGESDGQVWVRISDTGSGIAKEHLPRIFDPFFSTKRVGEGTGLGLFISQGIVNDLGGSISVSSREGQGSTFEVRLPASRAGFEASRPSPAPLAGRRRVLVIDDEPQVLRALERVLGRSNELTLAHSGREALSLLASGLTYELILCDLMMPEVSGIDVWAGLTAEQRARTVFMTGGVFTERAREFLDREQPTVLDKPFSTSALERVLGVTQSR